jgi:hypothetical protein
MSVLELAEQYVRTSDVETEKYKAVALEIQDLFKKTLCVPMLYDQTLGTMVICPVIEKMCIRRPEFAPLVVDLAMLYCCHISSVMSNLYCKQKQISSIPTKVDMQSFVFNEASLLKYFEYLTRLPLRLTMPTEITGKWRIEKIIEFLGSDMLFNRLTYYIETRWFTMQEYIEHASFSTLAKYVNTRLRIHLGYDVTFVSRPGLVEKYQSKLKYSYNSFSLILKHKLRTMQRPNANDVYGFLVSTLMGISDTTIGLELMMLPGSDGKWLETLPPVNAECVEDVCECMSSMMVMRICAAEQAEQVLLESTMLTDIYRALGKRVIEYWVREKISDKLLVMNFFAFMNCPYVLYENLEAYPKTFSIKINSNDEIEIRTFEITLRTLFPYFSCSVKNDIFDFVRLSDEHLKTSVVAS